MTVPDSMFLFKVIIEELISYNCKEFNGSIQFANIFTCNLNDPNVYQSVISKRTKTTKTRRKTKAKHNKTLFKKPKENRHVKSGQSILFKCSLSSFILNMKLHHMELVLWGKGSPIARLGSTNIPWSSLHIDYLNKINRQHDPPPLTIIGVYEVSDKIGSKRVATIKLNIMFSYQIDKLTQFRSLCKNDQDTIMCTGIQSKPAKLQNTFETNPIKAEEKFGLIKTSSKNKKDIINQLDFESALKPIKKAKENKKEDTTTVSTKDAMVTYRAPNATAMHERYCSTRSKTNLIKSVIDIKNNNVDTFSKPCSSVNYKPCKLLDYIFSEDRGSFGNKVYCVGYFTVENDFVKSNESSKVSLKQQVSEKSTADSKNNHNFKICNSIRSSKITSEKLRSHSLCSLDFLQNSCLTNMTECNQMDCEYKNNLKLPVPSHDSVFLIRSDTMQKCCDVSKKVEEIVGEMKAKMTFENSPCYCSCECTFGFTKKTTYCGVCAGYEKAGEDLAHQYRGDMPFPCPVFHKLIDKNKLKTWSTSNSSALSKKKGDDSQRSLKVGSKTAASEKRSTGAEKSIESEKDSKKSKKKKRKDDRFKFNYGYQGIPPQIGHSRCAFPCAGTLGSVPKTMGWLWTAENVPGVKFRPLWKPGAINKHVVRLLKMAKNPGEVLAKKKKKDVGKKKKLLKRPLLIVHKKDGQFTVTMETMKSYARPRAINHPPFDDKPLLTYTIGRTEEENRDRQRRKEREFRRLERAQRQFIQSAFKDVCRDICIKTYEQALGLLPGAEDPDCPCYSAYPYGENVNKDVSCSCSEEKSSLGSDTDSDEWVVEFTPPNALYEPSFKSKKVVKTDNSSQYTYLDYKVKLLDRYGNPVQRFFKGPNGKQECSDLGGFWSPDHKWLEINVDGYIAPDERWAPNSFIGPNGEQVDADIGKFQTTNGKWLIVGIDGYIDAHGKWKFYSKRKSMSQKKPLVEIRNNRTAHDISPWNLASETAWSCFGDVTPKQLSKMGIVGHGHDKKLLLSTLKDLMAQGEDVRLPQLSSVPHYEHSKIKSLRRPNWRNPEVYDSNAYFSERAKCKHPVPSEKGVVAVDTDGNKVYFRLKDVKNKRPKDRLDDLKHRGISLSAFHVPCFHSFINSEIMKREQRKKLVAIHADHTKCVYTQIT